MRDLLRQARPVKKVGGMTAAVVALATALTALAGVAPAEAKLTMRHPTALRAVKATETTLKLDWYGVRHAPGYRIQYSTSPRMTHPHYARFRSSYGTLRGLESGRRYWFRARVINLHTGASKSRYTRSYGHSAATKRSPVKSTPPLTRPTSTPDPGPSTGASDLRVGSFNISDVTNDSKATGPAHVWRERRPVVAREILEQHADVVGLQEANMSTVHADNLTYGDTQYDDLVGELNARGGHYAVTSRDSYNCVRAWSSQSCSYQYRGASNSTRVLYDTDVLEPVIAGSYKYQHQTAGKIDRYMSWGVFRVKATGSEVFFATTHLDSYNQTTRQQQWSELIAQVNQLKNGRPVVITGDFNTSKWDSWAATYLPRMKAEGYGDALGQGYATPYPTTNRAQSIVHGWVNSFNGYRTDVSAYGYEDAQSKIGNNIDWIFASNDLVVKQWETVLDFDPYSWKTQGVLPSDHNMVRATLTLP